MSSKYVRGVKRNQIIQRWLQGIEDPDYEVFPTKKEGKYIVKLRDNKISDLSKSNPEPESIISESKFVEQNESNNIQMKSTDNDSDTDTDTNQTPPSKPKISTPNRVHSNSISTVHNTKVDGNYAPQTINLEILEQLRNLGEEIRNDRFKREQKQYIKHVVNKELNKSRIRSKYVPDVFVEQTQPENDSSVQQSPSVQTPEISQNIEPNQEYDIQPEQHIFRSRIRR